MAIRWRTPERDEPKPRPLLAAPDLHPAVSAPDMVMRMQASAGNQATVRMLAASGAPGAVERVAREASTPLPQRAALERALGTDLSDVRVQLGGAPARAALHARSAHAAAVDRSIVFDDTAPSTEVIAHEVAHVLQQHRGRTRAPDGDCENEALLSAPRLARGEATVLQASASPGRAQYLGFTQGAPTAPVINHDHGFLDTVVGGQHTRDASKLRAPTLRDRAALARGELMLEGAEMLRPDLIDGTRGYRHFLHGNGAPLTIEYDRFLMGDAAGQALLARALTDTRAGAIEQDNAWMAANPGVPVASHSFHMQSEVFGASYPATENWQKAIGGHSVWITADVTVSVDNDAGTRSFDISLTIHMEDMYNFNPGASDIATGQPDSDNGRLEVSGLGQEFLQTGQALRNLSFSEPLGSTAPGSEPAVGGDGPRAAPDAPQRRMPGQDPRAR